MSPGGRPWEDAALTPRRHCPSALSPALPGASVSLVRCPQPPPHLPPLAVTHFLLLGDNRSPHPTPSPPPHTSAAFLAPPCRICPVPGCLRLQPGSHLVLLLKDVAATTVSTVPMPSTGRSRDPLSDANQAAAPEPPEPHLLQPGPSLLCFPSHQHSTAFSHWVPRICSSKDFPLTTSINPPGQDHLCPRVAEPNGHLSAFFT